MKRFLTLSIVAMTAFSCTTESVTPQQDGDLQSLGMSISMSDVKSNNSAQSGRAIVGTEATPGAMGVLLMRVYDPADTEVATEVKITDGLLASVFKPTTDSPLNSSDRIVVEKIKSTASYVRIMGYYNTAAVWEELTDIDAKNVNVIQDYSFDKVPFVSTAADGKNDITKGTGMGDGVHASHKAWTVEANIKPYFAHIQMKGKPTVNGATITLDGVYLNALNKNKDDADVTTYEGNHAVWKYDADGKIIGSEIPGTAGTEGDWEADYETNFGQMHNGDHTDKYSAFHLWPATERPHVILEVTVTPTDGSPAYKGYITITSLTGGTGSAVEAGKIYNVDLGSLTIELGDITPDPESKPADLHLQVTVENWDTVTLTPEL